MKGLEMIGFGLLALVTVLYAGYNLLIKVSGGYVPAGVTTTVLATVCLQLAALLTSILFIGILALRGGHTFSLSANAYLWAALAGICIGGAEIAYFYLFSGVGVARPFAASIAIPTIVSGTVVIAMVFSFVFLKEAIGWHQLAGSLLIVSGIVLFFVKSPVHG